MMVLQKKRWFFVICIVSIAALATCLLSIFGDWQEPKWKQQIKTESLTTACKVKPADIDPITTKFQIASWDFGLNFLRYQVNTEKKENALVSPASALFALGMTGNGAGGETLWEFEQVLGNGIPIEELSESYGTLLQQYRNIPTDHLTVANSIWIAADKDVVLPSFLETNARYFSHDIYVTPSWDSAKNDMNIWVFNQTNGLISQMYGPEDFIDKETFMILINTVFFHMGWEKQFNDAFTQAESFFPTPGQEIPVMMMNGVETMDYFEQDGAVGFLKPYTEANFKFLAILPPEGQSPEEFLKALSGQGLSKLLQSTSQRKISLAMPKFTLEAEINLNNFLIDAGMDTAFHNGNFTQMCSPEFCAANSIQIDRVLQKNHMEWIGTIHPPIPGGCDQFIRIAVDRGDRIKPRPVMGGM